MPQQSADKTESYPTPLYVLICDRCTHLMTFSKTMMLLAQAAKRKNGE